MLALQLKPDPWLAEVMSRPVYRVLPHQGTIPASEALKGARGFYFARVPTADVRTAHALADLNFRNVDVGITLECDSAAGADDARIRPAESRDHEAVVTTARNGFAQSRFHLDPAIPKPLADRIKAEWAGNYFAGRRGDNMVVAEHGGRVVGFTQLLHAPDGALVIDLIAVESAARGQGLGSAMVRYAARLARNGRLRVGTQAANIGSLRLYENLGFRTVASDCVMHLHA